MYLRKITVQDAATTDANLIKGMSGKMPEIAWAIFAELDNIPEHPHAIISDVDMFSLVEQYHKLVGNVGCCIPQSLPSTTSLTIDGEQRGMKCEFCGKWVYLYHGLYRCGYECPEFVAKYGSYESSTVEGGAPERIFVDITYNPKRTHFAVVGGPHKSEDFGIEYVRAGTRVPDLAEWQSYGKGVRDAAKLLCTFCGQGIPTEYTSDAFRHHLADSKTAWVVCRANTILALLPAPQNPSRSVRVSARAAHRITASDTLT